MGKVKRHTRPMTYEERLMHNDMQNAPELLDQKHKVLLDAGINRSGGCVECDACGLMYYDHPRVVGALWATELCDGRLVKL